MVRKQQDFEWRGSGCGFPSLLNGVSTERSVSQNLASCGALCTGELPAPIPRLSGLKGDIQQQARAPVSATAWLRVGAGQTRCVGSCLQSQRFGRLRCLECWAPAAPNQRDSVNIAPAFGICRGPRAGATEALPAPRADARVNTAVRRTQEPPLACQTLPAQRTTDLRPARTRGPRLTCHQQACRGPSLHPRGWGRADHRENSPCIPCQPPAQGQPGRGQPPPRLQPGSRMWGRPPISSSDKSGMGASCMPGAATGPLLSYSPLTSVLMTTRFRMPIG
ncbi:uncharacterized protein LOC144340120 [Macaca mulatta]